MLFTFVPNTRFECRTVNTTRTFRSRNLERWDAVRCRWDFEYVVGGVSFDNLGNVEGNEPRANSRIGPQDGTDWKPKSRHNIDYSTKFILRHAVSEKHFMSKHADKDSDELRTQCGRRSNKPWNSLRCFICAKRTLRKGVTLTSPIAIVRYACARFEN